MTEGRIVKPLAVFIVVVVVLLGGIVLLALADPSSSGPPDGQSIDGQSPPQYQPGAVDMASDPEDGEIQIDTDVSEKRILIDTGHDNQLSKPSLEPMTEAVFDSGHTIEYGSLGVSDAEDSLGQYDGILIIQPLTSYSPDERDALQEYTESGGRVAVLAEPSQARVSSGPEQTSTTVSFGANTLTQRYGIRVGAEQPYNIDDDSNDNNFKSIYASPSDGGELTTGVETITLDTAGYAAITADTDTETTFTAAAGTRTLETRRTGTYPVVVRNDNMVFVADSTFITTSEVYDADNEVFVSNLIEFLLNGDVSD